MSRGHGAAERAEQGGAKRPDHVGGEDGAPQPGGAHEIVAALLGEEWQDRLDGLLGKELEPAENDDDEAAAIAEIFDERPPGGIGKMKMEKSLAEDRGGHGEPRSDA